MATEDQLDKDCLEDRMSLMDMVVKEATVDKEATEDMEAMAVLVGKEDKALVSKEDKEAWVVKVGRWDREGLVAKVVWEA